MKDKSRVTIVIPVYNRADLVRRTLESVAAQTLRPLSVVVVDNNSTDGSLEVARQWASEHHADDLSISVVSEPRRGAAIARNRGLSMVETPWTMFFDSDDTMHPELVAEAMRLASASSAPDIVGWDVAYIGLDGKAVERRFDTDHPAWNNIMHGSMATQRYMARTEVFRRAGGWDESLSTWDDIELGMRICDLSPRRAKLSARADGTPWVRVYVQEVSISGIRFSDSIPSTERALRVIMRRHSAWAQLKWAIFAGDCAREGSPEAGAVLRRLLDETPGRARRVLWRIVYLYKSMGGRGAARLLAPFFRNGAGS